MAKQQEGPVEDKGFYKLGPRATTFWDENQPDTKKLLPGQVVEFYNTSRVLDAKLNRALIEVGEKEFKQFQEQQKALQEQQQSNPSTGNADADATLREAQAMSTSAQQQLYEARADKAEAQRLRDEADALLRQTNKDIEKTAPKK